MSKEKIKLFRAKWDNSKCVNIRDREVRFGKREASGVVFPNGKVAVDWGFGWDTFAEMESHFQNAGNLEVTFFAEVEVEEQPHAQTA